MLWYKLLIGSIIYGLLILPGNQAKIIKKRGVMDNLNDGLKVAGQMFGINTAADVANLVAKAFSKNSSNRNKPDLFSIIQKGLQLSPSLQASSSEERNQNNYESQEQAQTEAASQFKQFHSKISPATPSKEAVGVNFGTSNLITSMLRMVGFDASKLGALAINALIMIASAIGNTLMGTTKTQPTTVLVADGDRIFNRKPSYYGSAKSHEQTAEQEENADNGPEEKYAPNAHQPRTMNNDPTTIEWFLQNSSRKMKRILKQASHNDLTEKLTDMITNYETAHGQAACLKMLVCKSSPFIWGMQKSIKKHIEPKGKEVDSKEEEEEEANAEKSFFNVQNFFTHLPSIDEYRAYGEKCEKQYSIYCNTTDLYK